MNTINYFLAGYRNLLFHENYVIANSKFIFKKHIRTTCHKLSLSHDSNPITQIICLIHEMCCKEDNSTLFVVFKHLPDVSTS